MNTRKKILVFLPNWVGDVVMATPALRAVREHFAWDHIAYLGRQAAAATLEGTKWADEFILDRSSGKKPSAGFWRLLVHLRRARFDQAILMPNSFRSAMLARLGAVRRVAGYSRDGRGWLLSQKRTPPQDERGWIPVPAIDYYATLVGMVGVKVASRRMELPVVGADESLAQALLAQARADLARPIVMVNPGASFGTSKLWDPRRFAALCDALIERHGVQIIINAAPPERNIAALVGQTMRHPPLINFAHRENSLGLLKALMGHCRMLVTNDTGARHIAAAMGIGVVTIFGSTDPDWTTIYYGRERIVRTDQPCSPCQMKLCHQPPGPLYHRCMIAISVEQVLAAAEEVLEITARAVAQRQAL